MRKLPSTAFQKGQIAPNRGLRHEAKLRGDTHYFTGKPCKNGHIEKRIVSSGGCMECARLQTVKTRITETEQQRLIRLQKGADRAAQWRQDNPEHENTKIVKKRWKQDNPIKVYAATANRRAAKLQRTPLWLTKAHHEQIERFYWEAAEISKVVGEFYHVDHIVPLQGKTVSGFHVPWNLQVLHAKQNLSKGNNHG